MKNWNDFFTAFHKILTAQTCLTPPNPNTCDALLKVLKSLTSRHWINSYICSISIWCVCLFFLAVCSHWFSSTKTRFNALHSLKMKVFIWGLSLGGIWAVQKASSMQNTNCWHIKSLFRIICSLYQVYLQGVFNVSQLGKLTKIQ